MSLFTWLRDVWYWLKADVIRFDGPTGDILCVDIDVGRWEISVEEIGRKDAPFWQASIDAPGEAHYSRIAQTPFKAFRAAVAFALANSKLKVDFEI